MVFLEEWFPQVVHQSSFKLGDGWLGRSLWDEMGQSE